ncbi:MAG TPA: intradiol ring-cleavage dioxygenase [Thermoanaerobaculia bacterium]|nr:intradiol ring-cleavage dioxygenase [Thermoanaerobaculia bacterium]
MKILTAALLSIILLAGCVRADQTRTEPVRHPGQPRADLYACEGCEAIYEHPHDDLGWETTIPPAGEPGEPLVLAGTVYQADGETPAPGVVVYAYHTNIEGVYPTRGGETGWARRHGYLRGWVRTDEQGRYRFHTIRPGGYPERPDPAHVHMTVKEPGHREYWVDEVIFADDPQVTEAERRQADAQGGSGLVHPTRDAEGVWHATRDIGLEHHPEVR